MKKRFFFRRPNQYSFDMWVAISDDRHEANFIASMSRKGYLPVTLDEYLAEVCSFAPIKRHLNKLQYTLK